MTLVDSDWDDLLRSIKNKKCTPFIGAGASAPWIPLGGELARTWAEEYGYPLEDCCALDRVAQFLAVKYDDDLHPKLLLSRSLERIRIPDLSLEQYRKSPYAVLADLHLPAYITTNYDIIMECTLRIKGKDPVTEFCRWN